ncbi:hypothetical protein C1J05_11195 [Sulfitobacter sp. JL08]|uniref:VPLPA-CTERM sorting domain-containing protein n=1 Tax=Sulfitobacter sp. JL08 TaxID=2070369 RepID=UPI000E0A6C1A|nr:hypothetical protein C1J05_11195 [Sulfitobacter sp. JL08]
MWGNNFMMSRILAATAVSMYAIAVAPLQASVVFSFQEVSGDVVVTSSGVLDLAGLTYYSDGGRLGAVINPSTGEIGTGPVGGGIANADVYYGLTSSPEFFGPGGARIADFGSGSGIFLRSTGLAVGDGDALYVPLGYSTGEEIFGTAVYEGTSFDGLGLVRGRYEYSWASDSVILDILGPPPPGCIPSNYTPPKCEPWRPDGLSAVPLPAAVPMLLAGIGGLGFMARRKRKSQQKAS